MTFRLTLEISWFDRIQLGMCEVNFVFYFTKFKLYSLIFKKSAQQSHSLHMTGLTGTGIDETIYVWLGQELHWQMSKQHTVDMRNATWPLSDKQSVAWHLWSQKAFGSF